MIIKTPASMRTVTARIREKIMASAIQEYGKVYRAGISDVSGYQLAKFNDLWVEIQRNVPYYQKLVQSGRLPSVIESWEEYSSFPILTRASIQSDVSGYIDCTKRIDGWSVTGGSTGTPFRVPFGSLENKLLKYYAWLGRGFNNLQVSDRMFQLWGHAHRFGNGWRRYYMQAIRTLKNSLLGHQVFSAYHLTPDRLHQAGKAIIRMRPDFIMGYSRSLVLLAKENEDLRNSFMQLPIKAVVATTESFNRPEDQEFIEYVFGCPVAMEYGAAETGVLAYTHPSNHQYQVLWDSYLLEAVPVNETDSRLLITALYPRVMPLIRYDIGDTIRNFSKVEDSVIGFDTVLGRDNDLVDLGGGAFVHPVAIIHSIQSIIGVLGIQVIQETDGSLSISVMCKEPLAKENESVLRRNLATLAPQLGNCNINYIDRLEQTLAGKTKWVIRR